MKPIGRIARRYLFSKKHVSLISTLTMISVTGVTIGTALLIIVLSVFNGFFDVIKGLLLNNDPDIRITSAEGQPFRYTADLQEQTDTIPEVQIASPYVAGKALLTAGKKGDRVVSVRGVHRDTFNKLSSIEANITSGTFDLGVRERQPGLVMTETLMADMGLFVGQEVALLSANGMQKSLTQFSAPRVYRFQVRGAYSLTQIIENSEVFIEMEAAQRLFGYRNTISGIDLRLQDNGQSQAVKEQLQTSIDDSSYTVASWYDLQKPLYDVMYLEKWGAYTILMIIVLVAVLNIIGSLTMIVLQKKRDIGVLLTIGFTPDQVKQIFIRQGLYIGLIGCGLGGALGLFFSWLQQQYGIIKLSSAFIISAYPVQINGVDIGIVLAGSLVLCLLASWYPARRASQVEPADAVRFN